MSERCANQECFWPLHRRPNGVCFVPEDTVTPEAAGYYPCTRFQPAEPGGLCVCGDRQHSHHGGKGWCHRCATCTEYREVQPEEDAVLRPGERLVYDGEGEPCPAMNKPPEPVECSGCKLNDYCEDQVDDETICTRYVPKEKSWVKRELEQASRDVDSWPPYLRGPAIIRAAQPPVECEHERLMNEVTCAGASRDSRWQCVDCDDGHGNGIWFVFAPEDAVVLSAEVVAEVRAVVEDRVRLAHVSHYDCESMIPCRHTPLPCSCGLPRAEAILVLLPKP